MKILKKKNIYLDNAGATPLNKKVGKIISSYQKHFFANPSSIYKTGTEARSVVEEARKKIANLISAHSDEIIFTGSGTESDSLALIGLVKSYHLQKDNINKIPHIITTNIEHPAILENCHYLEKNNLAEVTYIEVDENGIVNSKDIKKSIKENTILISVMYANNEIGSIQPISEIAKEIRHFKKQKKSKLNKNNSEIEFPLFHTDACQAVNYLPMENIERLGVDMLSFNGSKIYGPKGIGVLYKKRNIKLEPLYYGGGQEYGLISGTENVVFIIGITKALEETFLIKESESLRLTKIRDYAIDKLLSINKDPFKIKLNGGRDNRLPNNINISVSNISSELLVLELDAFGIQVSEKSACHSSEDNSSYVIKAIRKSCGRKRNTKEGSIRLSLGRDTTKGDMDILIKSLNKIFDKYKEWK